MSEEVFKAIIAAQDQTAATFEAIIARLQKVEHAAHAASHAAHEVAEHGGAFHAFSEHVHELGEHFGELREHIAMAAESATEFLPALAALGGVTSMVGLFEMTEKVSESFSEMNAKALGLGVSIEALRGLHYAAQMTDVPVQKLDAGLSRLSVAIGQVNSGKNKNLAALFAQAGIGLKDASGHAKTAADVFPELAEAFRHTTDATMRSRAAAALFGLKVGKDLLPLLLEGKEGIEEFTDQAAKLNYTFTSEDKENLEAYHRSMIGLKAAVGGFVDEIGAGLAPILEPTVDGVKDWVAANRDWISADITERVRNLVKALGVVDWAGWAQEAHRVGDAMVWLHDTIGNVGVALIGLTAITWSNPILAAIGAVILGAQEVYNHWGPIRDFFIDLWAAINDAFNAGWAKIKPIVDALKSATEWIGKHMPGGDGAGPSVTERATAYIEKYTQTRELPGPRASSERRDSDDPNENHHVARNWLHDLFVRRGDGADGALPGLAPADPLGAPALAAPPPALLAPPSALAQPAGGGQQVAATVPIELRVKFDDAPPGLSASVTQRPPGPLPVIDVGHAMPGFGYGH